MFEETNSFDSQMNAARVAFRLADMMREQASRPHVGDELNGRVKLLTLRADEQEAKGERLAQEAFRFSMFFQFSA